MSDRAPAWLRLRPPPAGRPVRLWLRVGGRVVAAGEEALLPAGATEVEILVRSAMAGGSAAGSVSLEVGLLPGGRHVLVVPPVLLGG